MDDTDLQTALTYTTPCVDKKGRGACKVYKVTVENTSATDVEVSSNIVFNKTGNIDNLKWQELYSVNSITNSGTALTGAENGLTPTLANTTSTNWRLGDKVSANDSKSYYIAVWVSNVDSDQALTDNGSYTATVTFNLGDEGDLKGDLSFATDSWADIAKNIKKNPQKYDIGSIRCITLSGFTTTNDNGCSSGEFKIRVANNTSPSECSGSDYSETACGFVVEFVDIISQQKMNSTGTNVGSWPSSEMYTYVNETIYGVLPNDLQSVIIPTKSVTGHGYTQTTNFVSNDDKLYLLSPREVWGKDSFITSYDSGYAKTRQLDFYKNGGVTTSNYAGAIKQFNGSNFHWWLRAPNSDYYIDFWAVSSSGINNRIAANNGFGVSPAFRIG